MLGDADISEETLFALPSQVREKNVLLHFWRLITLPATSYLIKDMMFNMFSLVTRLIWTLTPLSSESRCSAISNQRVRFFFP